MKDESLVASKVLWDSLGNFCKIEMYQIGPGTYEVYTSAYDEVPRRLIGSLGTLTNWGEHWLAARKAEGFTEQLPSYQP